MTVSIKKAIFPVAGLGTRLLPITKSIPKEMLPIIDKPLIQFAIEEAIDAGIKELCFIINDRKLAIKNHLSDDLEIESWLIKYRTDALSHIIKKIVPKNINCTYIQQPKPLGLGHAVLQAKKYIGNEAFAVILVDELLENEGGENCLKQIIDQYDVLQNSILAVNKIAKDEIQHYGIVTIDNKCLQVNVIQDIVEKPLNLNTPSAFAAIGRYIFKPSIFAFLEKIFVTMNTEIQLTSAIQALCKNEKVYAHQFTGSRYDCGRKIGYLEALLAHGTKHSEVAEQFKIILKKYVTSL